MTGPHSPRPRRPIDRIPRQIPAWNPTMLLVLPFSLLNWNSPPRNVNWSSTSTRGLLERNKYFVNAETEDFQELEDLARRWAAKPMRASTLPRRPRLYRNPLVGFRFIFHFAMTTVCWHIFLSASKSLFLELLSPHETFRLCFVREWFCGDFFQAVKWTGPGWTSDHGKLSLHFQRLFAGSGANHGKRQKQLIHSGDSLILVGGFTREGRGHTWMNSEPLVVDNRTHVNSPPQQSCGQTKQHRCQVPTDRCAPVLSGTNRMRARSLLGCRKFTRGGTAGPVNSQKCVYIQKWSGMDWAAVQAPSCKLRVHRNGGIHICEVLWNPVSSTLL